MDKLPPFFEDDDEPFKFFDESFYDAPEETVSLRDFVDALPLMSPLAIFEELDRDRCAALRRRSLRRARKSGNRRVRRATRARWSETPG